MVTLTQSLAAREAVAAERAETKRTALLRQYVELLRRDAKPREGDTEALAKLAADLGKSAAEVERDAADLAKLAGLRLHAARVSELTAARAGAAARYQQAHNAVEPGVTEVRERLQAQANQARAAATEGVFAVSRAKQAAVDADALEAELTGRGLIVPRRSIAP